MLRQAQHEDFFEILTQFPGAARRFHAPHLHRRHFLLRRLHQKPAPGEAVTLGVGVDGIKVHILHGDIDPDGFAFCR